MSLITVAPSARCHDLRGVAGQRTLEIFCFVPRRIHPDVHFLDRGQSLVLGTTQIFINVAVNALIAIAAGSIAAFLTARPTWPVVQRGLMGTVLAALAVRMAAEALR